MAELYYDCRVTGLEDELDIVRYGVRQADLVQNIIFRGPPPLMRLDQIYRCPHACGGSCICWHPITSLRYWGTISCLPPCSPATYTEAE